MTRLALRLAGAFILFHWYADAAELNGSIVDPAQHPVPEAAVTITHRETGQSWRQPSDSSGRFDFRDLPPGEYLITAEAPGMSAAPRLVRVAQTAASSVEVALEPDRVRTEIAVTATASAQTVDTISRSIDVIRRSDWEERGVSNVSDAIEQTPGLRVQNLGGPGSFSRLVMRGLRGQDTAITIDGMRFRDAGTTQGDASNLLENTMLVDTQRVEVLRGSGSAQYGSNAIGGVVNLVSASGSDAHHADVTAEGGGLGLGRGLIRASGPLARNLYYSAGLQHLNVSSGVDGQDPFRNTSFHGSTLWRPKSGFSLSGRVFGTGAFVGLNDSPYVAPANLLPATGAIRVVPVSLAEQRSIEAGNPAAFLNGANLVPNLNDPDSHRAARFAASAVQLAHQLTPRLSYRASYQNVYSRRIFEDGPAGARFEPQYRSEDTIHGITDTAQTRLDWLATPKVTVGAGYEWEREDYRSRNISATPGTSPNAASVVAGSHTAFGYAEARLVGDRLHLSIAGRVQRFSLNQPEFEGGLAAYRAQSYKVPPAAKTVDAGLAWFIPSSRTKLRAHAGNGYRAPALYERFGAYFYLGQFTPIGDPRLQPDRSTSLDAGIDQYLFRDRVRITATSFYTDLREVIGYDSSGFVNPSTDPYGRFGGYFNTGGAVARGIETQAEIALPKRVRSLTSYSYTNSEQRVSTVRDNDFFRTQLVVPHQFTSLLMAPVGRRLDVTTTVWLVGAHANVLSRRAFLFDGARRVDLSAGYLLPFERVQVRLQTRASNILNSRYLESGYRAPGFWATAGFQLSF